MFNVCFIRLRRTVNDVETETIRVWLHFENREKMLVWGQSEEHAKLVGRIDEYRTCDWEATWYDTEFPRIEKFVIPAGKHSVL